MGLKGKYEAVFMVALGVGFVLLSLFAAKLGLSGSTFSSFGRVRWFTLLAGFGLVGVGVFNRPLSSYLAARLPVIFVMVLIFDNILYTISPVLPKRVIEIMSEDAQKKYWFFHSSEMREIHNGTIWYRQPNISVIDPDTGKLYFADELGYANEKGYLSRIKKSGLDVLLVGSSYVESGPVPDDLHNDLAPLTVYTIGMGGQGLPYWGLQFDRFARSRFFNAPRIVVLNFYGGREISLTLKYLNDPTVPEWISKNDITWPHRKFSFFTEVITIVKNLFRLHTASATPQIDEQMSPSELPKVFKVLSDTVEKIRQAGPQTKVLLSYIPTPGAIYGPDYNRCLKVTHEIFPETLPYVEACHDTIRRQAQLSAILSDWSQRLKIYYLDPTLPLRKAGQVKVLHLLNDPHMNEEGDRIYAEAVAKNVLEILKIGKIGHSR